MVPAATSNKWKRLSDEPPRSRTWNPLTTPENLVVGSLSTFLRLADIHNVRGSPDPINCQTFGDLEHVDSR